MSPDLPPWAKAESDQIAADLADLKRTYPPNDASVSKKVTWLTQMAKVQMRIAGFGQRHPGTWDPQQALVAATDATLLVIELAQEAPK